MELLPLILALLLFPIIHHCFVKFVLMLGSITPKDIDISLKKYNIKRK